MQPNTYLIIILIIIATQFLTTLTISLLNYNYKKAIPKEQTAKKDYIRAKRYLKTNIKFSLVKATIDTIILLVVILTGLLNVLDLIIRSLGYGPIITGVIFFGVIGLASSMMNLPFSIFKIFYIEKKYGFNKTTKKTFILDIIKSMAGWIIIGGVGLFIILTFFEKTGTMAWLYCWVALTLIQIFTMFIYPVTILPIFNKLKILKDGQLKEEIKEYLDINGIDIKIENIKIMDSSRRTSKVNAFLTGFGKNKRLVLADTLLKNYTQEEILAIVAHEVGHLRMNHLPKKLIVYSVETF